MAIAGFPVKTQNGFAVTESRRRGESLRLNVWRAECILLVGQRVIPLFQARKLSSDLGRTKNRCHANLY